MTRTEKLIAIHEGYRKHVYTDTTGHKTIGFGINLDAGLSKDEAWILMKYKVGKIREKLSYGVPVFNSLSATRQDVLIDMTYNLGYPGFLKFKKMLAAINESNFTSAAYEMSNSTWAGQVGARAEKLADMMVRG